MKLLFITDEFPYPPSLTGNTENIFHIIKYLRKIYSSIQLDLMYIKNQREIPDHYYEEISKYVNNIYFQSIPKRKYIRLSKLIYKKNLGIKEHYDNIMFCSLLSGYTIFNFKQKANFILYQGDSRTLQYSKYKGINNKLKYYKFKFEQKLLFPKFNKVIFVSQTDANEVKTYINKDSIFDVIPVGVEINNFSKDRNEIKEYDLVFTGNYSYKPNRLAAIYIINELTPYLVKLFPNIKICIAGRNPDGYMKERASAFKKNIIITGEVPSLSDYIAKSKLYISPLFHGSGMKNKILQAMASSKCIIASEESVQGFPETKNFIISKNRSNWIHNIKYYLDNDSVRKQKEVENYNIVKNNYSFEIIVEKYFSKLFNINN